MLSSPVICFLDVLFFVYLFDVLLKAKKYQLLMFSPKANSFTGDS